MMIEIDNNGIAELRGAANAFADQQGYERLLIVMGDLPLLPLLHSPSGFANVVNGVTKIGEDTRVDSAATYGVLQMEQLGTGFLELKIHTPESFAGDQQLDGDANDAAFFSSNGDNTRAVRFVRNEIGELELAANTGEIFHVQQAALAV